jgi:hypothetical protein
MTIHLTSVDPETMLVRARAERGDGHADLLLPVTRGGTFHGWTFDELLALGEGEHVVGPKPTPVGVST